MGGQFIASVHTVFCTVQLHPTSLVVGPFPPKLINSAGRTEFISKFFSALELPDFCLNDPPRRGIRSLLAFNCLDTAPNDGYGHLIPTSNANFLKF